MLRLYKSSRTSSPLLRRRRFSTSSSSGDPNVPSEPLSNLRNSPNAPSPPALHHDHRPSLIPRGPSAFLSRNSLIAAFSAATLLATYAAAQSKDASVSDRSKSMYADLGKTIENSNESIDRIVNRTRQMGVAASVLWQSLRSVMSSANHEVRAGFELRVAALIADIVAASDSRRVAIVGAGGGAVVDWLLETVAGSRDGNGTQAESARALAYLIADPNVCEAVLGRPQAVPNLLRFIFSAKPKRSKKVSCYFLF